MSYYYGFGRGMAPAAGFSVRGKGGHNHKVPNNDSGYMLASAAYEDPDNRVLASRTQKEYHEQEFIRKIVQAQEERDEERARYIQAKNRVLATEMEVANLQSRLRRAEMGSTPAETVQDPKPLSQDEPKNLCKLCFDREINATFTCGHTSCYECGLQTIDTCDCCPFCKKKVQVNRLYF